MNVNASPKPSSSICMRVSGARRAELLAHQLIGGQRRFLIRLVEYSVHGCGEFFLVSLRRMVNDIAAKMNFCTTVAMPHR